VLIFCLSLLNLLSSLWFHFPYAPAAAAKELGKKAIHHKEHQEHEGGSRKEAVSGQAQ
jgi:hypothetical protein